MSCCFTLDCVFSAHQVSVIYFRCGYSPDQYPTEREWEARLLMERSRAIKSPSIHYHLAATKKVQQELAKTGALERFLKDPEEIKAVRDIFTGLFPIGKVMLLLAAIVCTGTTFDYNIEFKIRTRRVTQPLRKPWQPPKDTC